MYISDGKRVWEIGAKDLAPLPDGWVWREVREGDASPLPIGTVIAMPITTALGNLGGLSWPPAHAPSEAPILGKKEV